MRFVIGIFLVLLFGGLNAVAADLSDLRAARSLVAEAALVLRLDAQHRLTAAYVSQTRDMVREQLQSELKALGPHAQEAELIRAALAALNAGDPRRLD